MDVALLEESKRKIALKVPLVEGDVQYDLEHDGTVAKVTPVAAGDASPCANLMCIDGSHVSSSYN